MFGKSYNKASRVQSQTRKKIEVIMGSTSSDCDETSEHDLNTRDFDSAAAHVRAPAQVPPVKSNARVEDEYNFANSASEESEEAKTVKKTDIDYDDEILASVFSSQVKKQEVKRSESAKDRSPILSEVNRSKLARTSLEELSDEEDVQYSTLPKLVPLKNFRNPNERSSNVVKYLASDSTESDEESISRSKKEKKEKKPQTKTKKATEGASKRRQASSEKENRRLRTTVDEETKGKRTDALNAKFQSEEVTSNSGKTFSKKFKKTVG